MSAEFDEWWHEIEGTIYLLGCSQKELLSFAFDIGRSTLEKSSSEEMTKLKEALREAVEVIGFYAEEDSWEEFQHISLTRLCISEDDLSSCSYAKRSGGRRAREFQSKHAAIIAEITKGEA